MVDEDVVKPIETPRLDGQRGCPHALLDEGDTLLAEGRTETAGVHRAHARRAVRFARGSPTATAPAYARTPSRRPRTWIRSVAERRPARPGQSSEILADVPRPAAGDHVRSARSATWPQSP